MSKLQEAINGVWVADFELAQLRRDAAHGRKALRRKTLRFYVVGALGTVLLALTALCLIGTLAPQPN